MQNPEHLKLNPVNVVQPQAQADYSAKQLIILEAENSSLASASLTSNYILGGHIDRDPLNTAFSPDGEHANVLLSGAHINKSTFVGHYPGLNADALDDSHPTIIHNSRFVLVTGRGYKFQVVSPIHQPVTAYQSEAVGQGANLSSASFKQADLTGTDFTGCNLEHADFTAANLSGCNFTGANLAKASFNGADVSGATFVGANLGGADLSSTVTSDATNFSHAYLVGAHFYALGGKKFAYLGCFQGTIFAAGQTRIEVANADFSRVSGLVDGQFACYYKFDIALPTQVECLSTNRFMETREAEPEVVQAAAQVTSVDWGDGF